MPVEIWVVLSDQASTCTFGSYVACCTTVTSAWFFLSKVKVSLHKLTTLLIILQLSVVMCTV